MRKRDSAVAPILWPHHRHYASDTNPILATSQYTTQNDVNETTADVERIFGGITTDGYTAARLVWNTGRRPVVIAVHCYQRSIARLSSCGLRSFVRSFVWSIVATALVRCIPLTSSICEWRQVSEVVQAGCECKFAHTTFARTWSRWW